MNTSIYMFICDNYIFINIFDISVNFVNMSRWDIFTQMHSI